MAVYQFDEKYIRVSEESGILELITHDTDSNLLITNVQTYEVEPHTSNPMLHKLSNVTLTMELFPKEIT